MWLSHSPLETFVVGQVPNLVVRSCLFIISFPARHLLKQEWTELISLQAVQTRRERKGTHVVFFKILPVLSPAEYEALRVPAAVFVNITPEEITKKTEDKR